MIIVLNANANWASVRRMWLMDDTEVTQFQLNWRRKRVAVKISFEYSLAKIKQAKAEMTAVDV